MKVIRSIVMTFLVIFLAKAGVFAIEIQEIKQVQDTTAPPTTSFPGYPNGQKSISQHIAEYVLQHYPIEAVRKKIEGLVTIKIYY